MVNKKCWYGSLLGISLSQFYCLAATFFMVLNSNKEPISKGKEGNLGPAFKGGAALQALYF